MKMVKNKIKTFYCLKIQKLFPYKKSKNHTPSDGIKTLLLFYVTHPQCLVIQHRILVFVSPCD